MVRSLNFFCHATSQSNANTRLTKASSSPKIEWRETRCLVERGRGRGSVAAGEPAQVCLLNAVEKYAFLAPFTWFRLLSPPVLSKIAIRRTCWEPEKRQIRCMASFDRTFGRRLFRGAAAPRSAASTAAQGPSPNYCSPYTRVAVLSLQGFIFCNAYMF